MKVGKVLTFSGLADNPTFITLIKWDFQNRFSSILVEY